MTEEKHTKNARTKDWYDSIWKTVGKCVFCYLKEKYIIYEENNIVLTVNIYPYIEGHLMAVPRRHIGYIKDLTNEEWATMRKMSYIAKKLLKKLYGYKGMWTLIREGGEVAGMSVQDHLHMQLIPFDAPDLCQWNYREIKHTALEIANKYKKNEPLLKKSAEKFERKYSK